MSGTIVSSIPALIPDVYQPGVVNAFFANTELFGLVKPQPAPPGDSVDWKMSSVGTNGATATTEGASLPAANVLDVVKLTLAKQSFVVSSQISQEAQWYSDRSIGDPWAYQLSKDAMHLVDVVNTTLLTALEAAVDSAGAIYGQTRSSYAAGLTSYEESTTASISEEYLRVMVRTLTDADRANNRGDLVMITSPTLHSKLAKVFNQSTGVAKVTSRENGSASVDGGFGTTVSFDGIPIIPIKDMTSTTLLCGPLKDLEIHEQAAPQVHALGKVDRSDKAYIDCNYCITVRQPALWGKLTNKS